MTDQDNRPVEDRLEGWEREEVAVRHYLLGHQRSLPDVDQELAQMMERLDQMKKTGSEAQDSHEADVVGIDSTGERHGMTWRWLWGVATVAAALVALFVVQRLMDRQASPDGSAPIVAYEAQRQPSRSILFQQGRQAAVPMSAAALKRMTGRRHSSAAVVGARQSSAAVMLNRLTVPAGMVAEVTLPDGTEVWVNAASRLEYPEAFGGDNRTVTLRGEAYFKVKHDAAHPFIVKTEGMATRVLGTEFNVRAYHAEASHVTLLKGSVEVTAPGVKCRVKPGEDVMLSDNGRLAVTCPDTETYTAWKSGDFYFDDATLWDVARELGRWYNVSVVFNEPADRSLRLFFSADRGSSLSEIVELLNGLGKAKVSLKDGLMIIG